MTNIEKENAIIIGEYMYPEILDNEYVKENGIENSGNMVAKYAVFIKDPAVTKYHISWDWLIPVLHKIALNNSDTIETNVIRLPSKFFGSITLVSDIELVYNCTVDYIKSIK